MTFFRVANEGHGFGYPESQLYAAQLQLNFFRDHHRRGGHDAGGGAEGYLPADCQYGAVGARGVGRESTPDPDTNGKRSAALT